MKEFDILYARDMNGNILFWQITIIDDHDENFEPILEVKYGRLEGAYTERKRTINYVRNEGRANETTFLQQAIKEATSDWKAKKKEGYKSLEDLGIYDTLSKKTLVSALQSNLPKTRTDANNRIKPMLCKPFVRNKLNYPVIGQPKINGDRGIIFYEEDPEDNLFTKDSFVISTSKKGMTYKVKHIAEVFEKIFADPKLKDIRFDGEYYIFGESVTSISGAVKNPSNPLHSKLVFIVFDLAIDNVVQKERIYLKSRLLSPYAKVLLPEELASFDNNIKYVGHNEDEVNPTNGVVYDLSFTTIKSDREALDYRDKCIAAGYEGCVLRDQNTTYKFGSRPMTIMKFKQWEDAEFVILDIIENDKNENSKFICRNDINKLTFEVTPVKEFLGKEIRLNKDKYIGKEATIKFYERSSKGLPFNATLIGIKDL